MSVKIRCKTLWVMMIQEGCAEGIKSLHRQGGPNSTLRDQITLLRGGAVGVQYFQVENSWMRGHAGQEAVYRKIKT